MRIVSGKHKGRRITAPKKLPVRPTTDQAKEALFNILKHKVDLTHIHVLDLFSGIGSIALEFASRGTQNVTAVDQFYGCVKFLKKTAEDLEVEIDVIKSDVFDYLSRSQQTFDVIFADPPYDFTDEQFEKIVDLVFENQLLNPGGIIILEHSKHSKLAERASLTESRKYGNSVFSFYTFGE